MTRRLGATSPICCGHCATAPTRRARPATRPSAFSDCWGLRRCGPRIRRRHCGAPNKEVADHRRGRGRGIRGGRGRPGGSPVPDSRAGRSAEHQCIVWGPGAQSTGTRGRPANMVAHNGCGTAQRGQDQLTAILLSPQEVTAIMGGSGMQADPVANVMWAPPDQLSDPDCLGTDITAAAPVYDGSGWSAVRTQKLTESQPDDPDSPLFWVQQAAVAFPRPTWLARSPTSRRTNGGDARAGWSGVGRRRGTDVDLRRFGRGGHHPVTAEHPGGWGRLGLPAR